MIWIYPVIATALGSIVADLVSIGVAAMVDEAAVTSIPTDLILGAAVLNAAVCAVVLIPARLVATRWVADEAGAW
jgi:hypothetical protein